jgi:tetratricopeptide (TPR) repeat protein
LRVFSARRAANPGEGFLSLRLRGSLFAALLGLLAPLCVGQDPGAPNQAPQSQSPQGQAPQSQTPQGQPAADQPAAQDQSAPQNESSSKEQPAPDIPPPKIQAPPRQPAAGPVPQNQTPISLDSNETIFAVLAALNTCGYDQDLTISDATRSNVRAELQRNLRASKDANRNISQYISLALYLDGPPHFVPRLNEEELPPDASAIAGFGALLERFYEKAGLHSIWERHRNDYTVAMRRYHEPLAKMVFDTEIYLKQPSSQYLGRRFTIYLDFMGSPNETDARNYGADYYVVVFPAPNTDMGETPQTALKMEQIRHTFLHYEMDPLASKHFTSIKRLEPLLQSVKRAPLEDAFKSDISLLVTECLVRAIEIRTTGGKQAPEEAMRAQAVDDAVKQGYILTRYFYDAMVAFEKDPAGIRAAYSDFVNNVDLKKEERLAAEVQFASATSPELVRLSRPEERRMLMTAEKRLAAGDPKGAQELAQQALDKKIGDQGRALFILAEVAVANKNRDDAQDNFQKAIAATQDPKVVGWSHVYLGRILDMKEDRAAAVEEYRAALTVGGGLPEVKAAAERGLEQAYEPPAKPAVGTAVR